MAELYNQVRCRPRKQSYRSLNLAGIVNRDITSATETTRPLPMAPLTVFTLPLTREPPVGYGWNENDISDTSSTTAFRAGVDHRDIFRGVHMCVICGYGHDLEHCHIIPQSEPYTVSCKALDLLSLMLAHSGMSSGATIGFLKLPKRILKTNHAPASFCVVTTTRRLTNIAYLSVSFPR
jgi:hypothetical protein